jgi:acetyl esterase/lipase
MQVNRVALVMLLVDWAICPPTVHADQAPQPAWTLWPEGPPNPQSRKTTLSIVERGKPGEARDRAATGIDTPTLTVFKTAEPDGSALLIIPGGGYQRVVMDKEGYETARWFAERGATAFVLMYRLPAESWTDGADVVLQDAQRSMRIIRSQADRYGMDEDRIGVIGFSAGGHAAAILSTRFADFVYPCINAIDEQSARPDFAVLMYPVISMQGEAVHADSRANLLGKDPDAMEIEAQSPHRQVTATTPPTFVLHAADDRSVVIANSLMMHEALYDAGVPTELHIFTAGGHGFGIRGAAGLPVAAWPELAREWMRHLFEKDDTSD